jgi:hypothetical protein
MYFVYPNVSGMENGCSGVYEVNEKRDFRVITPLNIS